MDRAKHGDKDYVPPQKGGCWFCNRKDDNLVFDCEWDTDVHIACIKEALLDPNNQEAEIMRYLTEE